MREYVCRSRDVLFAILISLIVPASLAAQNGAGTITPPETEIVREITVEEAVRLALENNLGIQIARLDPQIQDLSVVQARANWAPIFTSTFSTNNATSPTSGFLSGTSEAKVLNEQMSGRAGIQQTIPWGGARYTVSYDTSKSTTNSFFNDFNPSLRGGLNFSFVQPLTRNFTIDNIRQQVATSLKSREISELSLLETLDNISRTVQNTYWDLAFAIASFDVQQQSLDLARQSLRNTKARVEIGVQAPIDIVSAEAEVAQREESSIVAEAQVDRATDSLRTLIYNPDTPNFWTIRLIPADEVPFEPIVVDIEAAVRKALDERTDLKRADKNLETNDINIRYYRNQLLPEINAQFDYGLTAIGGTQLLRAPGFLGAVIGESVYSYNTILESIYRNEFPTWTFSVNVSYPLGTSQAEAQLARTRLQQAQSQTQLKNQQLQVVSQVRDVGRQVTTNRKRVETTRVARALGQRRLEAEQKKLTAGTSTSFFVFQAQRDLSEAQSNELRAVLDYNKSVVDFETVQRSPLSAGGGSGIAAIN